MRKIETENLPDTVKCIEVHNVANLHKHGLRKDSERNLNMCFVV